MDERPRLLYVYANSEHAARSSRFFRRQGWEVHLAASSEEALRLLNILTHVVVVIEAALAGDAAQTCRRIRRERPGQRVVVLGSDGAETLEAMAELVGAAALGASAP